MPGMTVRELILVHLWHVLVLGAVIYILCWLLFRQILLQPLSKIYLHLYATGSGKIEPLQLETHVTELRSIVDAVNLLHRIQRVDYAAEGSALDHARHDIHEICELVKRLPTSVNDVTTQVLERAADLEENLKAIALQRSHLDEDKATQKISPPPTARPDRPTSSGTCCH
jgi:hypothetical protein